MNHSLYAYLTRRTTEELQIILSTVTGSEDDDSTQTADMVLEILLERTETP